MPGEELLGRRARRSAQGAGGAPRSLVMSAWWEFRQRSSLHVLAAGCMDSARWVCRRARPGGSAPAGDIGQVDVSARSSGALQLLGLVNVSARWMDPERQHPPRRGCLPSSAAGEELRHSCQCSRSTPVHLGSSRRELEERQATQRAGVGAPRFKTRTGVWGVGAARRAGEEHLACPVQALIQLQRVVGRF